MRVGTNLVGPLVLCLGALSSPGTARAIEATTTPPMLRGDAGGRYSFGLDLGRLVDRGGDQGAWLDVARGVEQRHGIVLGGEFAPWHGLAVSLWAPITFHQRRTWDRALDMRYDPDADRATMVGGSELSDEVLSASRSSAVRRGFGDLRLGVRFVPFAQEGVPGREAPASMAVDVALWIPAGGNPERLREDGTTGPGTGGAALELGLWASRRLGTVEPFVYGRFHFTEPYRQALTGWDGRVIEPEDADEEGAALLDPRDEIGLFFGSELHALQDRSLDRSVRVVLRAGALFRSAGEVASGRLLPAPLAATTGHVAVESQHLALDLAWGLRARPRGPIEVRVDAGATWVGPHTLERLNGHTYEVRSGGDTFALRVEVGAVARFR